MNKISKPQPPTYTPCVTCKKTVIMTNIRSLLRTDFPSSKFKVRKHETWTERYRSHSTSDISTCGHYNCVCVLHLFPKVRLWSTSNSWQRDPSGKSVSTNTTLRSAVYGKRTFYIILRFCGVFRVKPRVPGTAARTARKTGTLCCLSNEADSRDTTSAIRRISHVVHRWGIVRYTNKVLNRHTKPFDLRRVRAFWYTNQGYLLRCETRCTISAN